MTGSKVLLDTNIISALLKGEAAIADQIDAVEEAYLCSIVIGELYYGAEYSSQVTKNISAVEKLRNVFTVLAIDAQTAENYGKIKAGLRKRGTPIPENDIWIAAAAKQHNLILVSRDKHFHEIDKISVIQW